MRTRWASTGTASTPARGNFCEKFADVSPLDFTLKMTILVCTFSRIQRDAGVTRASFSASIRALS